MSFNIRYANTNDGINNWDNRKEIVVNLIEEELPDLLGLQEVRGTQLNYLTEELTDYDYFGKSRSADPGDEHSPIFYKKEKFKLIESNTFWLSETPEKVSKGWDAEFNRIVTWGKLKHKETGKIIFYFNTHFDHVGEQARLNSSKLLRQQIKAIAGGEDYIVTGDFNIEPGSDYYKYLTSRNGELPFLGDVSQFSPKTREQIIGTFNGFDKKNEPTGPIDYIFVKETISVNSYQVIDTLYNGRFPSDHFPVKAGLELPVEK